MDIKNILLDLEVIKQIKENDKLAVFIVPGSKRIFVDTFSYISTITRWYNGYNRETSILYIEDLVDIIEKSSETIRCGNHNDKAFILKIAIENSFVGLKNLANTYEKDSIFKARITLCINNLKTVVTELQSYLDNIGNNFSQN